MFDVAVPLQWTLGGIYGTLAFAGIATNCLGRIKPAWEVGEVATRIRTWWAMTIVFTLALIAGTIVSITLFAVVSLVAMRELHRLTNNPASAATALSYGAVPVAYGLVALGYPMAGWVTPIAVAATLVPIAVASSGRADGFVAVTSKTATALLLTLWAPLHAILLLAGETDGPAGGAGLLVFLVLVTEVGDVAQFLSGKAFGRYHIAPVVSPNKTRGGLLGGVAAAMILGFSIGPLLTPLSAIPAMLAAAGLALFGFGGDLVVSAIKRDGGVKDTGTLLPGHGGMLDRIDSLVATAPLFAAIVWLAS